MILTCVSPQVMGPLTSEQNEMFLRNPRFLGLKFPDMTRPETLDRKFASKLPPPGTTAASSIVLTTARMPSRTASLS